LIWSDTLFLLGKAWFCHCERLDVAMVMAKAFPGVMVGSNFLQIPLSLLQGMPVVDSPSSCIGGGSTRPPGLPSRE